MLLLSSILVLTSCTTEIDVPKTDLEEKETELEDISRQLNIEKVSEYTLPSMSVDEMGKGFETELISAIQCNNKSVYQATISNIYKANVQGIIERLVKDLSVQSINILESTQDYVHEIYVASGTEQVTEREVQVWTLEILKSLVVKSGGTYVD